MKAAIVDDQQRRRGFKRRLFLIVFALIVIDQVSKIYAESVLPFHDTVNLVPFFSLYRTHNTGIAFSMLNFMGRGGLVVMTMIILAIIFWLWSRVSRDKELAHLGFAFVVAGAIGNLIDRFYHGHVIDFFLFHTSEWAFAVFNMADAFITLGAIAIIVDELFTREEPRRT